MAQSRVKTWSSAEVLTASDLNAEFNNILNNALSLISPLTGTLDISNERLDDIHIGTAADPSLNFNGDTNTGFYSPAADQFGISTGGVVGATFAATATNNLRLHLAGAFTSDGSSTAAACLYSDGILTGASGDTTYLSGTVLINSVTTQANDTVTTVSQ